MSDTPGHYRPPFDPAEFIAEPAAGPDERIDVGVLIVGAGPAGLAAAIRLAQRLEAAPAVKERLGEVPVAVVEKGKYPGAHAVSGAVVDPVALRELFPDVPVADLPLRTRVEGEAVYFLTPSRATRIPTPPTMRNHGNLTASLSEITRWMGERAEALGVTLLNETVAQRLLVQEGAVHGVERSFLEGHGNITCLEGKSAPPRGPAPQTGAMKGRGATNERSATSLPSADRGQKTHAGHEPANAPKTNVPGKSTDQATKEPRAGKGRKAGAHEESANAPATGTDASGHAAGMPTQKGKEHQVQERKQGQGVKQPATASSGPAPSSYTAAISARLLTPVPSGAQRQPSQRAT